jgi:hypothetical protein
MTTKARKTVRKVVKTTVRAASTLPGSQAVKATVQGVLGLTGERMSKVDTAWLRMDSQANLMMIVGVWLLKPSITYEALCERVTDRLLPFPRFTQMAIEDAAGATWVQDPNFKLKPCCNSEWLRCRCSRWIVVIPYGSFICLKILTVDRP